MHTGAAVRVRVEPARAGSGLRFRLDDAVEFPARADYIVDTRRATVLGSGEHRVSTVEHLLSALLGMGVDNALIRVDGGEIPVEDGSSIVFADAIAAVGLAVQNEPTVRFIPTETRVFRDGEKLLIIVPASSFRIRMTVDYAEPVGAQYFEVDVTPETYRETIASNRTFGFRHEVEALLARGLALGGTLDNAIVFDTDGPMTPLRSPNEPVRHKILDLIGDFALFGAVPQCEVIAIKSGHKLHCTAVRELAPTGIAPNTAAAFAPS